MKEEELLRKLRSAFKCEAEERIGSMSSSLIELEKASAPEERKPILDAIFREAHSLKGAARAVNLTEIETLCQTVEGVFAALKREEIPLLADLFDTLHDSVGAIESLLSTPEKDTLAHKERISTLVRQLGNLQQGRVETAVEKKKGKEEAEQRGKSREQRAEKTEERREVQETEKEPEEKSKSAEPKERISETPLSQEIQQTHIKPLISETVRISTSKLDSLLLKAEELISLKLMSSQHLADLQDATRLFDHWKKGWTKVKPELRTLRKQVQKEHELSNLLEFLDWNQDHVQSTGQKMRTLTKAAEQDRRALGSMVDDLLDEMKEATMLSFSILFEILPGMVRDISREQGKEVDLVLQGGEIEMDRRILEEMKDPLIHLLRNAIDHGLEDAEKRIERQKPSRGTINLTVSQAGGSKVEILLSDDGGGIDLTRVKEKAIKLEIISKREAEKIKDQEALSLIFRSEVSTSPIITEISGRGLGLAIVQENVEKLGGLLSVENNPGKGVSFRIQLPVTLATFRGILVRVADNLFVVPSSQVERISRIQRDEIKTVENRATISLNGRVLSFLELAHVLELPHKENQKDGTAFVTVMVLGAGEKRIAFKVDEVLSEQEVLVKSLGKQLIRVPNFAGATVLGIGKVVPILSVGDLLKSPLEATTRAPEVAVTKGEEEAETKSILVVEDSITSRMLLKNILEAAGYFVKTAVDGQDAYATLKTEDLDLVVSDVEMPRMDGFELTAKIRSDKRLEETPVVLVTALESREDRERGIDAGADAYIVKSSFDQSNLLEVVGRLI